MHGVDIRIDGHICRSIAIFLPHAGDPIQEFQRIFDELTVMVSAGLANILSIVVGGDFNTSLHKGVRWELLSGFLF